MVDYPEERAHLYHYTDGGGLKGIIEKKCLWATDYRYLNDAREMLHGFSLFDSVFEDRKRSKAIAHEHVHPLIASYAHHTFQSKRTDVTHCVFVASLTAAPDLLSQWRGYNRGKGYSIGFDKEWVAENAELQQSHLSQVIYDENSQKELLNKSFDNLEMRLGNNPIIEQIHPQIDMWWSELMADIATIKDPSFSEEQEWRLIKVTRSWPYQVKTRSCSRGLIPYLELHLNKTKGPFFTEQNLGFGKIIVGPSLDDRQKIAVDALLASQKMRLMIEQSAIPFAGFD